MSSNNPERIAKVVEFGEPFFNEGFRPGLEVYLTEQYYEDTNASVLEVPRYGWEIKAVVEGVATIEYQRPNWKLLMSIMCETKYLKRQL